MRAHALQRRLRVGLAGTATRKATTRVGLAGTATRKATTRVGLAGTATGERIDCCILARVDVIGEGVPTARVFGNNIHHISTDKQFSALD